MLKLNNTCNYNLGARAGCFGLRFAPVFFGGKKKAPPKKNQALRIPGADLSE